MRETLKISTPDEGWGVLGRNVVLSSPFMKILKGRDEGEVNSDFFGRVGRIGGLNVDSLVSDSVFGRVEKVFFAEIKRRLTAIQGKVCDEDPISPVWQRLSLSEDDKKIIQESDQRIYDWKIVFESINEPRMKLREGLGTMRHNVCEILQHEPAEIYEGTDGIEVPAGAVELIAAAAQKIAGENTQLFWYLTIINGEKGGKSVKITIYNPRFDDKNGENSLHSAEEVEELGKFLNRYKEGTRVNVKSGFFTKKINGRCKSYMTVEIPASKVREKLGDRIKKWLGK